MGRVLVTGTSRCLGLSYIGRLTLSVGWPQPHDHASAIHDSKTGHLRRSTRDGDGVSGCDGTWSEQRYRGNEQAPAPRMPCGIHLSFVTVARPASSSAAPFYRAQSTNWPSRDERNVKLAHCIMHIHENLNESTTHELVSAWFCSVDVTLGKKKNNKRFITTVLCCANGFLHV